MYGPQHFVENLTVWKSLIKSSEFFFFPLWTWFMILCQNMTNFWCLNASSFVVEGADS
jgi:hypothetical protein